MVRNTRNIAVFVFPGELSKATDLLFQKSPVLSTVVHWCVLPKTQLWSVWVCVCLRCNLADGRKCQNSCHQFYKVEISIPLWREYSEVLSKPSKMDILVKLWWKQGPCSEMESLGHCGPRQPTGCMLADDTFLQEDAVHACGDLLGTSERGKCLLWKEAEKRHWRSCFLGQALRGGVHRHSGSRPWHHTQWWSKGGAPLMPGRVPHSCPWGISSGGPGAGILDLGTAVFTRWATPESGGGIL